jgi:hypothetical protein
MMGLFTFLLRAVLLAVFTFGFVVLFEHGPGGFVAGVPGEFRNFENFVASLIGGGKEAAPTPTPAPLSVTPPAPTPAPPSANPPGEGENPSVGG